MRVFLIGGLVLLGLSQALANERHTPRVIRIHETISQQTLERLRMNLIGFHNSDPFPAGLIVLLDSAGGDGQTAMQIGRMFRQHRAHVFVSRRCDSACVFVLMGGIVRAATPGSVGVHASRLTMMTRDGKVTQEIDASRNLGHAYRLTSFNTEARQYLQAMGIGHGILDVMLAQPANRLYKLSATDLNRYQVNGIDPAYLRQRIADLVERGDIPAIDPSTFARRTLTIPRQCGDAIRTDHGLVRCYQQTLRGLPH